MEPRFNLLTSQSVVLRGLKSKKKNRQWWKLCYCTLEILWLLGLEDFELELPLPFAQLFFLVSEDPEAKWLKCFSFLNEILSEKVSDSGTKADLTPNNIFKPSLTSCGVVCWGRGEVPMWGCGRLLECLHQHLNNNSHCKYDMVPKTCVFTIHMKMTEKYLTISTL